MSNETVVREIVDAWARDDAAVRMAELVTPDYVHHTIGGDWDLRQFLAGLTWVSARLEERSYRIDHLVVEGDMAAAYLTWSAVRAEDGARIEGRGAYHCRFRDGRVAEDWDVFHPMPGE